MLADDLSFDRYAAGGLQTTGALPKIVPRTQETLRFGGRACK
jgi:hypothetical protein